MKIRMKGNSIRLRLTVSEVKTLKEKNYVSEEVQFGMQEQQVFRYAVKAVENIAQLTATLDDKIITLLLPKKDAEHWFDDSEVGFESVMPIGNNKQLHLLLEKDFVCLDKRSEDESDNYPNPKAQTIKK